MNHPYYGSHGYPAYYGPQPVAPGQPVGLYPDAQMLWSAGRTGALIGAAGSAAMQFQAWRHDQTDWQGAVRGTLRGAATAGVATAAGAAVGHLVRQNRTLSLTANLATAAAVMYALNSALGTDGGHHE